MKTSHACSIALLAVGLLGSLTSCKQKTSGDPFTAHSATADSVADSPTVPALSLTFDSVVLKRRISFYKDRPDATYCEVDIHLLYAKGEAADAFNDTLLARLLTNMEGKPTPMMTSMEATVDSFATRFEQAWRNEIQADGFHPDSVPDFLNFTYSLRTQLLPAGEGHMAYHALTETYQGGAHGSYWSTVINFDTATGRVLTLDDIFRAGYEAPLLRLIVRQLAKDAGLPNDSLATLHEAGYFWDEAPKMPTEFQLQPDGILFIYNVYDIACYAMGAQAVKLSDKQLNGLLK